MNYVIEVVIHDRSRSPEARTLETITNVNLVGYIQHISVTVRNKYNNNKIG